MGAPRPRLRPCGDLTRARRRTPGAAIVGLPSPHCSHVFPGRHYAPASSRAGPGSTGPRVGGRRAGADSPRHVASGLLPSRERGTGETLFSPEDCRAPPPCAVWLRTLPWSRVLGTAGDRHVGRACPVYTSTSNLRADESTAHVRLVAVVGSGSCVARLTRSSHSPRHSGPGARGTGWRSRCTPHQHKVRGHWR